MKNSITLGLAALSCTEFRRKHGHRPGMMRLDVMAAACDCSPQILGRDLARALAKMRVGLEARGVDRATALMAIRAWSQGGSYHCSLDEEVVSPEGR